MELATRPDSALSTPVPHPGPPRLRVHRVHEVCGASARAFAVMAAGRCTEPVIWIDNPNAPEGLCPQGLMPFFDPARLIVIRPRDRKQALWCMEESLRAAPALVIGALPKSADLTESRRLQLAAESGGATGLCLIPDAAQNNAAETRWRSTSLPAARGMPLHRWELIKNKKGILGAWEVGWNSATRDVVAVDPARACNDDSAAISSGGRQRVDALYGHE